MRRRPVVAAAAVLVALVAWRKRRHSQYRPFTFLLLRMERLTPESRARVQKAFWKVVYAVMNLGIRRASVGFLNYGYAPLVAPSKSVDLPAEREPDRYSIQLYAKVAGAVDLSGLDVLEVGCGRGGGTAFVFERYEPASMTGLDLSESSVAHCRRTYERPGLRFVAGDAERLPFDDASFDAVVNVESSHCYPDAGRFFAEVGRVLRPGGVLLFADMRHTSVDGAGGGAKIGDVPRLREQLAEAGFVVEEEEDITANVVRALELDSPRRRAGIERTAPRFVRSQLLDFAGVEGSSLFRAFAEHELSYLRMVLRPPRRAAEPAVGS
jgi:SAM-dependent methyltransferase